MKNANYVDESTGLVFGKDSLDDADNCLTFTNVPASDTFTVVPTLVYVAPSRKRLQNEPNNAYEKKNKYS